MSIRRGDHVWIKRDDYQLRAMILLASENEDSLMVAFEGGFGGYVGMMPLLRTDGEYRDLIAGIPVKVEKIDGLST